MRIRRTLSTPHPSLHQLHLLKQPSSPAHRSGILLKLVENPDIALDSHRILSPGRPCDLLTGPFLWMGTSDTCQQPQTSLWLIPFPTACASSQIFVAFMIRRVQSRYSCLRPREHKVSALDAEQLRPSRDHQRKTRRRR